MTRAPLFTFKHYAAVIRVLRALQPCEPITSVLFNERYAQWQFVVNALADMFAADNPKFKRALFITECTQEDKTK